MFVCDPCLKEHFTNSPSISRSHGKCELCDETRDCSDIRSSNLQAKPEPCKECGADGFHASSCQTGAEEYENRMADKGVKGYTTCG